MDSTIFNFLSNYLGGQYRRYEGFFFKFVLLSHGTLLCTFNKSNRK